MTLQKRFNGVACLSNVFAIRQTLILASFAFVMPCDYTDCLTLFDAHATQTEVTLGRMCEQNNLFQSPSRKLGTYVFRDCLRPLGNTLLTCFCSSIGFSFISTFPHPQLTAGFCYWVFSHSASLSPVTELTLPLAISRIFRLNHRSSKRNIRVCMLNCGWKIRVCTKIRRWH